MSLGINVSAVNAANYLNTNNTNLSQSIQKLSAGTRLAIPYQDAASVAVDANLQARIKRLNAAVNEVNAVVSYAQTVDGFLTTLQNIATRLSELTQNLTNGAFSSTDRNNYIAEATILTGQANTIVKNATFNGTSLFGGITSAQVNITVDANGTTDALYVSTVTTAVSGTFINSTSQFGLFSAGAASQFTDSNFATAAITSFNSFLTSITTARAVVNANISKFNFFIANINTENVNVQSADSRISNLDVANESTNLSKQNILVQSATAMLAQANTSQQTVLTLLH